MKPIRIVTYNMLKGRSLVKKTNILPHINELMLGINPDILVLQEAPGRLLTETSHAGSLHELLPYSFLGMNALTKRGEHGNAVFSKIPLHETKNQDLSRVRYARRGLISCHTKPKNFKQNIHLFCTHLDLLQKARFEQIDFIIELINKTVDPATPAILCGDFNDWNQKLDRLIRQKFEQENLSYTGKLLKTYPSIKPLLPLDRIYLKNLDLVNIEVPKEAAWKTLSDHLPLIADFLPLS